MDSLNNLKGYGKIDHLEDQPPIQNPNKKPLLKTLTITSILLLTLIIGLMLAALIHESKSEPPESPTISSSAAAAAIKTVCNVTRYPNACFSSISSLDSSPQSDPETIFKFSLQVSIKELTDLSSMLKSLNNQHPDAALGDCRSQFEDALSRLNDSVSAMEVGPGEKMLTPAKINDIQTWISAALTDEETCLDGLEEMESSVLGEVKSRMKNSKELISNSLAIIANIQTLLHVFNIPMH